jgi:Transposase DNA-binding
MAPAPTTSAAQNLANENDSWIDGELNAAVFRDARLGRRLRALLAQMAHAPGQSLPLVCQDWANTKAAYRFPSNDRVNEAGILAGHLSATRERIAAIRDTPVLVLHDTTEFSWHRDSPHRIGLLGTTCSGRDEQGRTRHHTVCAILMHSSLALTEEGLPLGLTAIKFWTRSKFKGTTALKRSINPTRVPIEHKESICWLDHVRRSSEMFARPEQCVHIGDRGSDIYELFVEAYNTGSHFIFRTCADRLAGDGTQTVAAYMRQVRCKALHQVEVRDAQGNSRVATLEIRY